MTEAFDTDSSPENDQAPACVLSFNASDPSGAAGLNTDVLAISSMGAHALPIVTGTYIKDTAEIFDHISFDEEAVAEQSRAVLEDVSVSVIKIGFCGNPENLSVIAQTCTDYADVPVVAHMPNLSWWTEDQIDAYLDAFKELILPQATLLTGNLNTLWRWLLPDWNGEKAPSPRDIAKAAYEMGTPYVLITGISVANQFIENTLSSPNSVLLSEKFERFDAVFSGTGDTLSAALSALLAMGSDLENAVKESLAYLDQTLNAGYRPGMGHVIPDRLYWLDEENVQPSANSDDAQPTSEGFSLPEHTTRH